MKGSDSESDDACSISENESTIGVGSDGTIVGVYRITVLRMEGESMNLVERISVRMERALNSFEPALLVSSVESEKEDVLGDSEGIVRLVSCSVVGTTARTNPRVSGSQRRFRVSVKEVENNASTSVRKSTVALEVHALTCTR